MLLIAVSIGVVVVGVINSCFVGGGDLGPLFWCIGSPIVNRNESLFWLWVGGVW